MKATRRFTVSCWWGLALLLLIVVAGSQPVSAQQKPNILFIMGDDIGWMQPRIYHGGIMPLIPFHFTLVQNIKRDPFEQAIGLEQKTALAIGGALGGPVTTFMHDFNILHIGQQLWLQYLESYITYPPLQAPESYNLSQVIEQVKKAQSVSHAGE